MQDMQHLIAFFIAIFILLSHRGIFQKKKKKKERREEGGDIEGEMSKKEIEREVFSFPLFMSMKVAK